MEEAYAQLNQEFLRLKSLCLRQAALLQQLTTALQKQKGAVAPNGELSDTAGTPLCLSEHPQPLAPSVHKPAAQCGGLSNHVGSFSNVLAQDMSKLCIDGYSKDDIKFNFKTPPLSHLGASNAQGGACQNASKCPPHKDSPVGVRRLHTAQMPSAGCPSPSADVESQSDGLLMSDVALQSHVCEFCQAVFPGDTTTRGAFLRHLYTHIT